MKYDYYKLRGNRDGSVDVLGFGVYEESSVLAGQTSKTFLDSFPDEAAALAAYPQAEGFCGHESVNTLNHLPGEDDMVPGGALPDDWS